jgi:hypothetical protein
MCNSMGALVGEWGEGGYLQAGCHDESLAALPQDKQSIFHAVVLQAHQVHKQGLHHRANHFPLTCKAAQVLQYILQNQ